MHSGERPWCGRPVFASGTSQASGARGLRQKGVLAPLFLPQAFQRGPVSRSGHSARTLRASIPRSQALQVQGCQTSGVPMGGWVGGYGRKTLFGLESEQLPLSAPSPSAVHWGESTPKPWYCLRGPWATSQEPEQTAAVGGRIGARFSLDVYSLYTRDTEDLDRVTGRGSLRCPYLSGDPRRK